MFYIVNLECGTTGAIESEKCEDDLLGTEVTVRSRDENGVPIQFQGIVQEVLVTSEYEGYPTYG